MPLSGVTEAAKDYHAKKAAAESGGTAFLSLDDGEEATLRFLEEGADFVTYYVHRLPQQGNRFPQVPCPDPAPNPTGRYPCKGCEDGHKRSFKFAVNVIHRNAKVPQRDKDNRVQKDANNKPLWETNADGTVKTEDQVKVWNGGITIAEDLDHLDGKYGGLTSRDFEVMRRGKKLDTSYTILPSGEARALSANDEKLRGAKFDLNQLKKAPEYEQFYNYRSGGGSNGASGSNGDAPPTRESPFRRRDRTES
jgi:hypothetical protein